MITELERLRLENEELHRVVQKVANFRTEDPYLIDLVEGTRVVLQSIATRRKAVRPKEDERIEQTCFNIVNQCTHVHITQPLLIVERLDKHVWHALLDGHVETIGFGEGRTALGAIQNLYTRVKSYRQRQMRGLSNWHPDRSWNTCLRQNCRGPVETEDGSIHFVDGCDGLCVECGALYIVTLNAAGGVLHRNRRKKALGT